MTVSQRSIARWAALMLVSGFCVTAGCESTVTSVGVWEPITRPVSGGGGGSAGLDGASGSSGGDIPSGNGGAASEATAGGELAAGGVAAELGPGLYLEAEDAEFTSDATVPDGGWVVIDDATASAGKYILPPASLVAGDMTHGSAMARYSFDVDREGDYLIWGRIYTPDIASNRFWFQVDGGIWTNWRMTVGTIWYWRALHENISYDSPMHFHLTAGAHELLIANNVPKARLDRLYITSFGDEPPGNTTTCHPPHSVDWGGLMPCKPSCGVQAMPDKPTTCDCGDRMDYFFAYDCTSQKCCYRQP